MNAAISAGGGAGIGHERSITLATRTLFVLGLFGSIEAPALGVKAGGMWVSAFEILLVLVAAAGSWAVIGLWRAGKFEGAGKSGGVARSERDALLETLRRPVTWALLLWGGVHVVSAAWSEGHALLSLKFGLRMSGGVFLALLVMVLGRHERPRKGLLAGILGGLAVITVLAVLERAVGQPMEAVLTLFRDEPTWMLGEQRLSSVFYHANTFAAYLEMVIPILVVLTCSNAIEGSDPRSRPHLGWLLWALLAGAMLSLTYSRAGLLAGVLTAMLLTVASLRGGLTLQAKTAALFGVLLILAFGANPDMRARLGVGERSYEVEYTFHGHCYGVAGTTVEVIVEVENKGSWPLSNRQAPGQLAWTLWDGGDRPDKKDFSFLALPNIRAGQRVDIPLRIRLPDTPGRYTGLIDVRRKDVIWLSELNNELGRFGCVARARGEPLLAADLTFTGHKGLKSVKTRRIELSRKHYWQAAARLLTEKPLLGHGADRFRLEHGRLVPPGTWDSRARAHSIVVETAADLGIVGLAALGLLAGCLAAVVISNLLAAGRIEPLILAASVAITAFALHSLVDYFLAYTKILALAWPLIGLACARPATATNEAEA